MQFKQYQTNVFKVLSNDSDLLKILFHLPKHNNDNPLDKEDILSMPSSQKWSIIKDLIKFTPSVRGLDKEPKCRVIFYNENRNPQADNYKVSEQHIRFDIFAHADYNDMDMRLSMICDRINDLMFDKRIAGMGKVEQVGGDIIGSAPEDYIGYYLVYKIGSGN